MRYSGRELETRIGGIVYLVVSILIFLDSCSDISHCGRNLVGLAVAGQKLQVVHSLGDSCFFINRLRRIQL